MRTCPNHATRFASAMVPILRNLPPLPEEAAGACTTSGGDDKSISGYEGESKLSMAQASLGAAAAAVVAAERSAAATASLLAVCRPLEAFLRTGMMRGAAPGFCSSTELRKRRRFGEKAVRMKQQQGDGGGGDDREGNAVSELATKERKMVNASGAAAAAVAELEEMLLPRCIVPLFEAAAGMKKSKGADQKDGSDSAKRGEMKNGSLGCLQALLEVSRGSAAGAALDALRKSVFHALCFASHLLCLWGSWRRIQLCMCTVPIGVC